MAFFTHVTGTTQKCSACQKTVYLVDRLATDDRVFHRACFRCHHCKGTLKVLPPPPSSLSLDFKVLTKSFFWQLGNYNSFEGVLYCRHHYVQLFRRTGSLNKSFDGA